MKSSITDWMGSLFKPGKKTTSCDCLKTLHLVIDGEATKEQEDRLMKHLAECLSCYNSFQLEQSVKQLIQNKIQKKPCPPNVLENIRAKLRQNA